MSVKCLNFLFCTNILVSYIPTSVLFVAVSPIFCYFIGSLCHSPHRTTVRNEIPLTCVAKLQNLTEFTTIADL